jgi:hypothetical protein
MTPRRARQAALRIQLILEEFTKDELASGLALIDTARDDDLFKFLSRKSARPYPGPPTSESASHPNRKFVLSSLKQLEPEKYSIIRDFEKALRDGSILSTLGDCRSFGRGLSKEFDAGKSRKDCIARLVAALSVMTIDEVRAAISRGSSYNERDGAEAFRQLAAHIITGGSS